MRDDICKLPSVQPSRKSRCEWGRMTYDYISKDIIFDFSDGTEKRVSRADQENVITLSRCEYDRLKALQPSRKGYWIYRREDKYSCSKCGTTTRVDESGIDEKPMYKFCPYCGADMRGVE